MDQTMVEGSRGFISEKNSEIHAARPRREERAEEQRHD
jgi:hypothetical protein